MNNHKLLLSILLSSTSMHLAAQESISKEMSEAEIEGIECIGSKAITETTDDIMRRQEELTRRGIEEAVEVLIQRPSTNRATLPQNPESPEVSFVDGTSLKSELVRTITSAPSVHKIDTNFTAISFGESTSYPPDSMGAIGWNQYIASVNGRIKTFNKCTGLPDGILDVTQTAFFQSVSNGAASVGEPRIRFDRFTSRWIALAITRGYPNRIVFAVSQGATITSSSCWKFFYFQQDLVAPQGNAESLADYPTLGLDVNALYIGANEFTTTGYTGSTIFVVKKSSILNDGPLVAFAFRDINSFTNQGVDNLYDLNPTFGYVIGLDNSQLGKLSLRRIRNVTAIPTMSSNISITVPTTLPPIDVPHLGNNGGVNGYLDGLDDRLMCAHIDGSSLWTTHSIGVNNVGVSSSTVCPTRNGCRWYQINISSHNPTLVQAGTLYQPSADNTLDQRHYWIPSIMTSRQGHVIIGCSVAGAQEYANAAFAGRLATDPLGTLRAPVIYTNSTAPYNPCYDPGSTRGRRWGNYSYTSLDPLNLSTIWTIQQWARNGRWATQVAQILAPAPTQPTQAIPASIPRGMDMLGFHIIGQSTEGTEFFAVGGPRSLKVQITGGVEVAYAQVINSTTIGLYVSTRNAEAGPQSVTITNGDGQSVTVPDLITIT